MKAINKKSVAIAVAVFIAGCAQPEEQARQDIKNPTASSQVIIGLENAPPGDRSGPKENKRRQDVSIAINKQIRGQSKDYPVERRNKAAKMRNQHQQVTMSAPAAVVMADVLSLNAIRIGSEVLKREKYAHYEDNAVKRVLEHPLSTFSIDVDTGAYANIRRMLKTGQLPPRDAVRTEELINYFSYQYPVRGESPAPFVLHKEIAGTPWNDDSYLLHIGIKAYDLPAEQRPAANLVFLVDVSGSMQSANKLGLLKSSLKLLTRQLGPDDRISIVVYAGASGVVLEPTPGKQRAGIISALDKLNAGGSTNGAVGIRLAYTVAEQAFIEGGINRVLLATDGDFNVGTNNIEQLKDLVRNKRQSGIALSTLGFGTGNYNDHLME